MVTNDPVLNAIDVALQALGYTTKPSTALQQLRSYDVANSATSWLISSVKRPTIGWVSNKQERFHSALSVDAGEQE